MNAQEALARTEAAADVKASPVRKEVDDQIAKAASEGKRSIYYFGAGALGEMLKRALMRSLEDDGFTLKYVADPDHGHPCSRPYTKISW
ncbi:MAG: hypothetical protein IPK48_07925 [Gammaproteobacteria bacterium]|nr:hypothetical protein [Gammaproteobacteria bacterium]